MTDHGESRDPMPKLEKDESIARLQERLQRGVAEAERGALLDGNVVFGELREMILDRARRMAGEPRAR